MIAAGGRRTAGHRIRRTGRLVRRPHGVLHLLGPDRVVGVRCWHARLHDQGADAGHVRRLRRSRRAERRDVRQLLVHEVPSRLRGEGPDRRGTGRSRNVWWPTGSRTRRWSTTATGPSPGRSTDHPRSCRTSSTARSTSPPPSDCPTTGSPASWSSARLRGQGLAAIALRGAVELIAQAGGGVVEGYPHDTGEVRREELLVPLQRHPHDVRARGLHLRPSQGPGQLRDGARGGTDHAQLNRSG